MSRPLSFGARVESALQEAAGSNFAYLEQLRAKYRHGVVAKRLSPDEALNYTLSLTASANYPDLIPPVPEQADLYDQEHYTSPEHALLAMAEYTGLGYEALPALRAAWRRGVQDPSGPQPFYRASLLAEQLYDSIDGDLLPKVRISL